MSSNLRNQICSLSASEKLELLDVLWESLEADLPPLSQEQQQELDSRVARYQQNRDDVIPWEHVRADLFTQR